MISTDLLWARVARIKHSQLSLKQTVILTTVERHLAYIENNNREAETSTDQRMLAALDWQSKGDAKTVEAYINALEILLDID